MKAHPERSIDPSFSVKPGAQVLADDFLDEVFTNILSNSVNYTEKDRVSVEIKVLEQQDGPAQGDKEQQQQPQKKYWKITFTDHGRGIPDQLKQKAFTRYLGTASGSGLGLSIVHALVAERYSGKVNIRDRVEGDYRAGTVVEVWLPEGS
jgi:signal transduction histidine kinase